MSVYPNPIPIEDERARYDAGHFFVKLPREVLRDGTLSHRARVLYALLLDYQTADGCYPGQERLAKDMGSSPDTVQRTINELEKAGLVKRARQGRGHTNRYTLKHDAAKMRHHNGDDTAPLRLPDAAELRLLDAAKMRHKGDREKGDREKGESSSPLPPKQATGRADEYLELLGPEKVNALADTLTEMNRTIGGVGWVRNTLRELATEVPGLNRDQLRAGLNLGLDRLERQITTDNGHIRNPPGLARYVFQRALEEQSE